MGDSVFIEYFDKENPYQLRLHDENTNFMGTSQVRQKTSGFPLKLSRQQKKMRKLRIYFVLEAVEQ